MIEYTEEYLIKLKALQMAVDGKMKSAINQNYEHAAKYRDAEKQIQEELGVSDTYVRNKLKCDIELLQKHLKRKDKLNNLLDESER